MLGTMIDLAVHTDAPRGKTMRDNRMLERFVLDLPTRILPGREAPVEGVFDLRTCNVCAGGAFFDTAAPLPEGTPVRIEMMLPVERFDLVAALCDEVRVVLNGRVLRREANGMAVQFDRGYRFHRIPAAEGATGTKGVALGEPAA